MKSKQSLALQWMRVSFFSILAFASFTAFLYLPHHDVWWRVATLLLVAFNLWGLVDNRRRAAMRRKDRSDVQI